jgi:hypothetical protein
MRAYYFGSLKIDGYMLPAQAFHEEKKLRRFLNWSFVKRRAEERCQKHS